MASDRQLAYMAAAEQSTAGDRDSRWSRLGQLARRRRTRRDAAHARSMRLWSSRPVEPVFYASWGVPDSRDGRLEMVSLHAILVMRRLRSEGRARPRAGPGAVRPDVRGCRPASARVGRGRPLGRQAGEGAGAELLRPRRGARPVARRVRPATLWRPSCGATSTRRSGAAGGAGVAASPRYLLRPGPLGSAAQHGGDASLAGRGDLRHDADCHRSGRRSRVDRPRAAA